ncbi:MAG TPA: SUMF1/EgtB/PvdO family nonheme iron enzyme, partial [Desulfatiglandales bacterium]|nr:SUMF1/EgtB/PvdO family nonheme iron enzyme [Desulfatiglandales bacterium]
QKESKGLGGKFKEKLKGAAEKVGQASAAFAYGIKADCKLGGFGFTLDASKMASREEALALKRIEEAKGLSDKLSSIYYEIVDELKSAIDERHFRIVAFIDDLDRCLPEKAVELLEAIKLFLDIEGYLFIMGVDREVVKKGISYRYRFFEQKDEKEQEGLIISPEDYLDKMIQLPLELPKIERGRKRKYIESLLGEAQDFTKHAGIIDIGVGDNPRTLKRFINLLAFTVMHAETVKDNILNDKVTPTESDENKEALKNYFIPLLYIKWTIIVLVYPKIHNDIKGNRRRLIELQEAAQEKEKIKAVKGETEVKTKIQVPDRLKKVLAEGIQFPDNDWLIDRFIHLTESTVIKEKYWEEPMGYGSTHKPGDMVRIPKGKFIYGDEDIEKELDHDYYIDVFPVTNKQYKEFIDATPSHEAPYAEGKRSAPYIWDKDKRTYPAGMENHPVVLVTHKDAEAFCKWRSEKEGKEIRLPTEAEWEKSARGEDGRKYPWGNDLDIKRLNCADYHVQKILKDYEEWDKEFNKGFYKENKHKALTSEVGYFEAGASPFGCQDMAGNVWEWTSSFYDAKKETHVLRGGSWSNLSFDCRCAYRYYFPFPNHRLDFVGFRCARTVTL